MLESYKWMGWVWDGMGMGWKSLRGVILRAPLCGANKKKHFVDKAMKINQ